MPEVYSEKRLIAQYRPRTSKDYIGGRWDRAHPRGTGRRNYPKQPNKHFHPKPETIKKHSIKLPFFNSNSQVLCTGWAVEALRVAPTHSFSMVRLVRFPGAEVVWHFAFGCVVPKSVGEANARRGIFCRSCRYIGGWE